MLLNFLSDNQMFIPYLVISGLIISSAEWITRGSGSPENIMNQIIDLNITYRFSENLQTSKQNSFEVWFSNPRQERLCILLLQCYSNTKHTISPGLMKFSTKNKVTNRLSPLDSTVKSFPSPIIVPASWWRLKYCPWEYFTI